MPILLRKLRDRFFYGATYSPNNSDDDEEFEGRDRRASNVVGKHGHDKITAVTFKRRMAEWEQIGVLQSRPILAEVLA